MDIPLIIIVKFELLIVDSLLKSEDPSCLLRGAELQPSPKSHWCFSTAKAISRTDSCAASKGGAVDW